MKYKKNILYLYFVFVLCSCNYTETKIVKYIDSVCLSETDSCVVDLRQILKIDYDSLYLFCEFTQPEEISSILNINYVNKKTITDSKWRIILLKSDKVVYEYDYNTRFLRFEDVTERIDTINKNANYLVHYNPYYYVTKTIYNEKDYYLLSPISDDNQYYRTNYNWKSGYIFEKVEK